MDTIEKNGISSNRHNYCETPVDPTFDRCWDIVFYELGKANPNHYYVDNVDNRIKIKRIAKQKIFNRIVDLAKTILSQKQYEVFYFYFVFYPHKTIADISIILGISHTATNAKLHYAIVNLLNGILRLEKVNKNTRFRIYEKLCEIKQQKNWWRKKILY